MTDNEQPPDILVTTKNQPKYAEWDEDAILASILPAIAHAFARLKTDFPLLGQMEISLLLTDDETISKLNHEWRDKNQPTNVLSFAQFSYQQLVSGKNPYDWFSFDEIAAPAEHNYSPSHQFEQPALKYPLGDIVLAWGYCHAEAQKYQLDFLQHVTHLFIHGFLHLLGYEHDTEQNTAIMQQLEIDILAKSNIANPYFHYLADHV